jgi:hypothetical protein
MLKVMRCSRHGAPGHRGTPSRLIDPPGTATGQRDSVEVLEPVCPLEYMRQVIRDLEEDPRLRLEAVKTLAASTSTSRIILQTSEVSLTGRNGKVAKNRAPFFAEYNGLI